MAQIIKHRRGSITQLKDVTARIGEIVFATGSIGTLNGPVVFVGETEGVAGAYRPLSKIYQGASAPTITVGSHGSVIDGTPFYSTGNKTFYILSKDGNNAIDLTGNIEGNTISGVTINNLTGTTAYIQNMSGSFTGSGIGLYDIPASGITGLELNRISEGSATASISQANGLRINVNTEITGALNVSGDITGSNLQLSGDAFISGNIVLGGNITVGDSDTDFVSFGADISSSIVPDVHNAFDLGSSTKNWRNIHVSGTAYIDTLEARQVNFTDLGVLEDLTVSGSTYLGNGGDITVISGSVYNDQLTEKRMVVVGTQGLLTDYSGLTFDNGNLNLSGALEVTNIQGTGSLYLKADKNDSRHFEIYNTSTVDTHIKSNGGLSFFGDDTNFLKIDDSLQTVTIDSTSGFFVGTTLQAQDTSELQGAVSMNSTLDVTGSATLKDNLSVSGTTTVSGATTLQNTLQVDSTSELKGAVGMNSTLDVTGSAQFKSTIDVDGEATLSSATVEDLTQDRIVAVGAGGSLIDYSGLTYNGTTFQIGGGQFEVDNADGDIRTSGSLTTNGLTNNGDLTVNGVLTVTGNTQLQSNLYISGNLEVLGSSTNVVIQSTTIELDDNIIRLNAYSPFERYAGFEVIDSGSTGVSASLVWDGLNDYWMFVSSSGQSSKLLGTTAGTYGSETSLTDTYFPIATGPNTIGDSLLRYSGTTLSFNTNKFTVDSGTGDTLVSGNFTLSYSGGTDNGTNTSAIMFRNSSNVVGFISTTETEDVLDGILGYKNSDGALVFSTVIDGGTY
jgi:cytoskeletal protein CcmA (bactofilin family)